MNYLKYYEKQIGSGPVFYGSRLQKGYGLGGLFSKFFRWISPIVKTHALPILKSGAQTLGKEAVKTAANVVTDAIEGKSFDESAKKHGNDAIQNLKRKAQTALQTGSGKRAYKKKKDKKVIQRKNKTKRRRLKDIFDFDF